MMSNERITGEWFPSRRSVVMASRGMVATSQPLAAQAGLQVLIGGGNAVDAAVATAAVLNVVQPMSTGIGGDVFALLYLADSGAVKALNASGRAPRRATLSYFQERGLAEIPTTGMLPVTVPGTVDGWATVLEAHGTMSLAEVLEPAITYAEEGFPVTERVARGWRMLAPKLMAHPDAAATYLVDGQPPRPGQVFRQPNLARTLRLIAEEGRDIFYRGEIADQIVRFSEANGGLLSLDDLAEHRSTWEEPIWIDYRGCRIYECPPNGQGLAALLALNVVQGYDLASSGHNTAEALHLLIEAMKLGFADAFEYVADPAFADIPLAGLLSADYTAQRRRLIKPKRALAGVPAGIPEVGGDTVYLTIVDGDGNAASFINSLYMGFGSGMVVGDTGIALQNRGALFSLDPGHRNCIAPGKRPYHTIIPALATRDGRLFMSFGVMGGFMQPQGHLQVVCNILDFGMNPQEALDAPRFRWDRGRVVALEPGVPPEVRRTLQDWGHEVVVGEPWQGNFGGGQVIMRDPESGVLLGGSEPRQDGCAVGY